MQGTAWIMLDRGVPIKSTAGGFRKPGGLCFPP